MGPGSSPKGNFCPRIYKCSRGHHDDVIKWKHFSPYWPFVPGIHRSPVNSPYKGQWRGALMFPLICAWIIIHAHYDVTVMANYDCRYQSIGKKGRQLLKIICTPLIKPVSIIRILLWTYAIWKKANSLTWHLMFEYLKLSTRVWHYFSWNSTEIIFPVDL